jgi:acyl carrier protein
MNIKEELLDLIVYQTAVDKELILSKETWEDMGIDSLDALEIMLSVSDKFNIVIGEEDEDKLLNFEQLLAYIELKIR